MKQCARIVLSISYLLLMWPFMTVYFNDFSPTCPTPLISVVTFQLVSMFKFSSFNCSGCKDLCCNYISLYMSLNQLCSILATLAAEILNLSTVWFLRRENFNADRLELEYLCALQKLIQTSIKFYI